MKYKLVILDIDGTITNHISSWRYIHEKLGLWDKLAHKYQKLFLKRKISYRRFCELDAAWWKGLPEKKIKTIFKKVPYAKNAAYYMKKLKKSGFKLAAISTGLQHIAERVKKELKFDYVISNRLLSRKGKLTGGVRINVAHHLKGAAAKKMLERFRVQPSEAIVVGDSAGDIPLIRYCGYSIAFNSRDKDFIKRTDYNCKTSDFKEVYNRIMSLTRS